MRMFAAVALLAALAGAPLLAHPGHEHKVMGTVVSADSERLVVKTKDGKEETIKIASDTKVMRGKKQGSADDLKSGVRVVVSATGEPLSAKTIEYAAPATTKQ